MRLDVILLLPAIAGLLFCQERQAGYVLAAQGQWKLTSKGNSKLSPGDPVNEHFSARAADQKATLTIAMLDGTVKSYDCPPLNPCIASIGAFRPPPDSLYARLFAVGKTFVIGKLVGWYVHYGKVHNCEWVYLKILFSFPLH